MDQDEETAISSLDVTTRVNKPIPFPLHFSSFGDLEDFMWFQRVGFEFILRGGVGRGRFFFFFLVLGFPITGGSGLRDQLTQPPSGVGLSGYTLWGVGWSL